MMKAAHYRYKQSVSRRITKSKARVKLFLRNLLEPSTQKRVQSSEYRKLQADVEDSWNNLMARGATELEVE